MERLRLNGRKSAVVFMAILTTLVIAGFAAAAELATNGDLETGDLTGWSTYSTTNGTTS